MDAMENMFLNSALTMVGRHTAIEFTNIINRYPPDLRPIVIGQIEALAAATRATFTEKQKEIADTIRDASQIVTILKDRTEEGERWS